MKLYGVFGKGSGKVGNSVWAISGGEQIVRPYNPNVTNPNTDAQIAQRAKLKLMSQLAASMAPAIVIPKKGLKSARNLFVSKNFGLTSMSGQTANVQLLGIQLTDGTTSMPEPNPTSSTAGHVNLALSEAAPSSITKVVYCLFKKIDGAELEFVANVIATTAGANRLFEVQNEAPAGELVVYAYGIKEGEGAKDVTYGDYYVEDGTNVATLETLKGMIALSGGVTKTTAKQVTVA